MSKSNGKPVKLELCLVATHEDKTAIEQLCKSLNVQPKWIKEKGKDSKYHMARIWFKRRLPPDFPGVAKNEN